MYCIDCRNHKCIKLSFNNIAKIRIILHVPQYSFFKFVNLLTYILYIQCLNSFLSGPAMVLLQPTATGGRRFPDGGRLTVCCSSSWICSRSFFISFFWILIILSTSSAGVSRDIFFRTGLPLPMLPVEPCVRRMTPKAASRSCTWVLAIFSSRRKSLISLIRVTFS